jgi:hypothetical protein
LLLCKQNELPNREIARLVKYMVEIFGDGGTDLQILKPILPYNKIPKLGRLFALFRSFTNRIPSPLDFKTERRVAHA